MKDKFSSDELLIRAISKGGTLMDQALKWLVQNEELNEAVLACTTSMGAAAKDAWGLLDNALIALVKQIRKNVNVLEDGSIKEYIIGSVKTKWCAQLAEDAATRTKAMKYISEDVDLKNRVIGKMKALECNGHEAEDYYHQGFVKLNEQLEKGNYQGGELKGYFFTICVNLRRNDRRKTNPGLPGDPRYFDRPDNNTERTILANEQIALLEQWLSQLSEKCQKTLQMWNDGYNMTEIAASVGYKDHKQAAQGKKRCLAKLVDLIDYLLWKKNEKS